MNQYKRVALNKIAKIGFDIDQNKAFAGKSKGNKHLGRVVRISRFLARVMNADLFVVTAGAYLHDTALPSGDDYNYKNNKAIVLKLLKSVKINDDERLSISECVASHEGTKGPKTLEAMVVHDADVLEKTGLLGLIRHTWKLTNSGEIDSKRIRDRDVAQILTHLQWRAKRLQTPLARKMARYLSEPKIDRKTAKYLVSVISALASDGIVTEKIAVVLKKSIHKNQRTKLREQLNLNYLKKFRNDIGTRNRLIL